MNFEVQLTEYGPMSNELLCSKLSALCIEKEGIQTGPFGSQLHKEDYTEIGTPIITVEHLGDNRIEHSNTPFVSDSDKERLFKYQLLEGDVVFSRVGSVDRRALVRIEEDGWLFSSRCLRVRVNKKLVNPKYLSYFFGLETFKTYIRNIAVGATMPSINTKILNDVPIYYPASIIEQEKIAHFLLSIDDKIHLNYQMNQTLEQMAQAIFKNWFVDFEPVKAKIAALQAGGSEQDALLAAMQAISGKDEDQLSRLQTAQPEQYAELKVTAELFPSAMQDSELGEIPEGWSVRPLADLIEFNPRRILKKGTLAPYLDMKNVPTSGHLAEEIVYREMSSGTKFINGDTLLARITPCLENGKTAYVDFLYEGQVGWGSTEYIVMRPQKGYPESIGYFVARDANFRQYAIQSMTGTSGRQRANAKALAELPWIIYPKDVVDAFDRIAQLYLRLARKHGDESKSLSQIRDTLLPKLFSGELAISNVTEAEEAEA